MVRRSPRQFSILRLRPLTLALGAFLALPLGLGACYRHPTPDLEARPDTNRRHREPQAWNALSRFSLGLDGVFSSSKASGDNVSSDRLNRIALPGDQLRLDYWLCHTIFLELPLGFHYESAEDFSTKQLATGLLLNYKLPNWEHLRPFVGAGPVLDYQSTSANGTSNSQTVYGIRGQLGINWKIAPKISLRPALIYEHDFKKDNIPAENTFGLTLGTTWQFRGLSEQARVVPPSWLLSWGGSFDYEKTSGVDPTVSTKFFDLPDSYYGLYKTFSNAKFALGGNVEFNYQKQGDISNWELELIPQLQYNVFNDYWTRWGIRLAPEIVFAHASLKTATTSTSGSQIGFGGSAVLTQPWFGGRYLGWIGLGYDHFGKSEDLGRPASNDMSLRFGMDALFRPHVSAPPPAP